MYNYSKDLDSNDIDHDKIKFRAITKMKREKEKDSTMSLFYELAFEFLDGWLEGNFNFVFSYIWRISFGHHSLHS